MKSKNLIFKNTVITAVFLFIFLAQDSFCDEQNIFKEKTQTTEMSFEQALKNFETQKQKEQEETAARLNSNLTEAIENWIKAAKINMSLKLNARLEQNWEKLSLSFPVSPVHYEYYLRGYKYSLLKSDITKSDSINSPYKAEAIIKEELYVEKNHSPDISDRNPYFYTVGTDYSLNFEYKNGGFVIINNENEIVSIDNDCPDEIKKLRL